MSRRGGVGVSRQADVYIIYNTTYPKQGVGGKSCKT